MTPGLPASSKRAASPDTVRSAAVSQPGFATRFREELSASRAKVAGALLVSFFAPALVLTAGGARATSRPAPVEVQERRHPPAPSRRGPANTPRWIFNAQAAAATCRAFPPRYWWPSSRGQPSRTACGRRHRQGRSGPAVPSHDLGGLRRRRKRRRAADIMDPLDALHAAARLLCANADQSPTASGRRCGTTTTRMTT